jgi:hypothetical protein
MKTFVRLILSSFICLSFFSTKLLAQIDAEPKVAKNAVYLEIGGNGMFYSFNYDRVFYQKGAFKSAARAGVSLFPVNIIGKNYLAYILPLEVTAMLGRSKHHLEIGTGVSPYLAPATNRGFDPEFERYRVAAIMPFRLGYRYQKKEGGFFFRAAYTPFIEFSSHFNIGTHFYLLYGGLSMGKSF